MTQEEIKALAAEVYAAIKEDLTAMIRATIKEDLTAMIREEINELKPCIKDTLTVDETATYTGIKKSYIYKLTSLRLIPHSKPNEKICYFSRRELDRWMMSSPIATDEVMNMAVQEYGRMNYPTNPLLNPTHRGVYL